MGMQFIEPGMFVSLKSAALLTSIILDGFFPV